AHLARRAVDAAEGALRLLGPEQLPATRLLFTVRVADCHLCADDPQTAVELLAPALAEAPADVPAIVGHELRGLRGRLAARRWRRPDHAAAGRRLAELGLV
ncbi:helix-turn-helix domain-containing protein, partial [Kitasatospora sp. NPDC004240]